MYSFYIIGAWLECLVILDWTLEFLVSDQRRAGFAFQDQFFLISGPEV